MGAILSEAGHVQTAAARKKYQCYSTPRWGEEWRSERNYPWRQFRRRAAGFVGAFGACQSGSDGASRASQPHKVTGNTGWDADNIGAWHALAEAEVRTTYAWRVSFIGAVL